MGLADVQDLVDQVTNRGVADDAQAAVNDLLNKLGVNNRAATPRGLVDNILADVQDLVDQVTNRGLADDWPYDGPYDGVADGPVLGPNYGTGGVADGPIFGPNFRRSTVNKRQSLDLQLGDDAHWT